ncbi:hypothetical protein HY479_00355 [Candidatus Uhrbacteria bacterium]|nr:hypothetical protein [Candidatus Uhrbacteria bacterium]
MNDIGLFTSHHRERAMPTELMEGDLLFIEEVAGSVHVSVTRDGESLYWHSGTSGGLDNKILLLCPLTRPFAESLVIFLARIYRLDFRNLEPRNAVGPFRYQLKALESC